MVLKPARDLREHNANWVCVGVGMVIILLAGVQSDARGTRTMAAANVLLEVVLAESWCW